MAGQLIRPIRGYLAGAAVRNILSAANGLLFPAMFNEAVVVPIVRVVPVWLWATMFGLVGVANLIGAVTDSYRIGRYSLIAAAALTFTIGFGLLLGATWLALTGVTAIFASFAPEAGLGFTALTVADYFVLTMVWRRVDLPTVELPIREQP